MCKRHFGRHHRSYDAIPLLVSAHLAVKAAYPCAGTKCLKKAMSVQNQHALQEPKQHRG